MTSLLQKAFDRAAKLPPETQDRLGAQLLTELDGDARWDALLAHSQSDALLTSLADAALKGHREGRAEPGGFGGK